MGSVLVCVSDVYAPMCFRRSPSSLKLRNRYMTHTHAHTHIHSQAHVKSLTYMPMHTTPERTNTHIHTHILHTYIHICTAP